MHKLAGLLSVLWLITWTGAAHAEIEIVPGSRVQHGNWNIEAFYDTETGDLSHCAVRGEYQSNDVLYFWFFSNYSLSIAVMRPNWGLLVKETYPAMLQVDSHPPHFVSGIAWESDIVSATPSDQVRIFKELRRGYYLHVKAENFDETYTLPGTNTALRYGLECVDYFMKTPEGRQRLRNAR